jgi:Tol biopolymer transport system component
MTMYRSTLRFHRAKASPASGRWWKASFCGLLAALGLQAAGAVQAASFELISTTDIAAPTAPNGYVQGAPDLSSDGRYTVFSSSSSNLVAGDSNNCYDIFVADATATGSLERVSLASDGSEANGCSYAPQISGDGRYVLFMSSASNLDPAAPGGTGLYLRDRQAGSTRRVDVDASGNALNSPTGALSRDGRYLALVNPADLLVYRKELQPTSGPGAFELVSVISDSSPVNIPYSPDVYRSGLAISDNGQVIAWTSAADVPAYTGIGPAGDSDGALDIFLRDMADTNPQSMVTLVSRAADGSNPAGAVCMNARYSWDCTYRSPSSYPEPLWFGFRWLSGDGQRVIFNTESALVAEDTARSSYQFDGYLFDRSAGFAGTRLLTLPQGDTYGYRQYHRPLARAIASDGTRALLDFDNTVYENGSYRGDVVVLPLAGGDMIPVVRDGSGSPTCCSANAVALSGDGLRVAFLTYRRLVSGDLHSWSDDVYLGRVDSFDQVLLTQPITGGNVRAAADNASNSSSGQVSADGRFVLFQSSANNLVAGDNDGRGEFFLRDRETGSTQRVGIARDPAGFTDCRGWSSMTPDARYVLYTSCYDDAGVGNSGYQVYRWDRQTGERLLVSRGDGMEGPPASNSSWWGMLSDDGRLAVFSSYADNLDPAVTISEFGARVYLRDIESGSTQLISKRPDGSASGYFYSPMLSGDGRYVLFQTTQAMLPGDTDSLDDIYRVDTQDGSLALLSPDGDGSSYYLQTIDADGGAAMARRYASQGGSQQVLLSADGGAPARLDLRNDGTPLASSIYSGHLSRDRRYAVFYASTQNFLPGEGYKSANVFVRDIAAGITARVVVKPDGSLPNDWSYAPRLSPDGRWIVFSSYATDLIQPDSGNGRITDVFLVENPLYGGELVSDVDTLTPAATEPSLEATVAGLGGAVVFESLDPKLHAPCVREGLPTPTPLCGADGSSCPAIGPMYVYLLSVEQGCVDLVSVDNAGAVIKMHGSGKAGGDEVIGKPSPSADGALVAFVAPNAVTGKLLGESKAQTEARQKTGGFSVLLRNMLTGTTRSAGTSAGATDPQTGQAVAGARPQVAPGGRAVVFTGLRPSGKPAINLLPLDAAGNPSGPALCVSCKSSGNPADPGSFTEDLNGYAAHASVSADGNSVVYQTVAKDAASSSCDNGANQSAVVLRNMLTGATRNLSQPASGSGCLGAASKPRIDWSGGKIVFESTQPLTSSASGTRPEAFLFDLNSNRIEQVSVDGLGNPVDAASAEPTISGDGKLIAFTSRARTGYGADLTDDFNHVVVRELRRNNVRRLSKNLNGQDANGDSRRPSLDYGGDFVVFDSEATNLSVADDNGNTSDVFLRVNPLTKDIVFDSSFE